MVSTDSNSDIRDIRFENDRLQGVGVEVISHGELTKKEPSLLLGKPERVDFYFLLLVTSGRGVHTVDFVERRLKTGSLIFVKPGQVQQWYSGEKISAQILLIDPATLPYTNELITTREVESLVLFNWQTYTQFSDEMLLKTRDAFQQLRHDINRFDGSELDVSLIRHELLALLFRLARWQQRELNTEILLRPGYDKYQLFLRTLESRFQQEHSLKFYAKRLGYSESTISRACLAVEGRTAKVVIDRRIILEAQRVLAHSSASVAEVGYLLGFSESTNFIKFFRRMTDLTPTQFRQQKIFQHTEVDELKSDSISGAHKKIGR